MVQLKTGHNLGERIYKPEEFVAAARGFDLPQALFRLQDIGAAMKNFVRKKVVLKDPRFPQYETSEYFLISRDGNAFIAKALIEHSSELSLKPFTDQDHKQLTVMHYNLETDLNYLNPKVPGAYKWIIRSYYPQFRYERTYALIFGRYLMMFDLPEAEFVNEMCKDALGLTFKEIATIGLSFFGYLSDNGHLNISALVNHAISHKWIKHCLEQKKVERFVEIFSTTPAAFRKECLRWRANETLLPLQKYEFNPLYSTPIIRFVLIGNMRQRLIAPSVPNFVYASCEGVYFKLMDAFEEDGKRNEFSNAFGKVHEAYVRKLLELAEIPQLPEDKNPKKLDTLILGDKRNVHIECKKNIMSNEARMCVGDAMEKFIERLAENVRDQLYKKRDSDSINLLVCMDDLHFFDERVKPLIEERLKRDPEYDSSFKFHILGITDLEAIVTILHEKNLTLEALFTAKEQEGYYEDAVQFAEKRSGHKVMEPAFLREKYAEFTASWK